MHSERTSLFVDAEQLGEGESTDGDRRHISVQSRSESCHVNGEQQSGEGQTSRCVSAHPFYGRRHTQRDKRRGSPLRSRLSTRAADHWTSNEQIPTLWQSDQRRLGSLKPIRTNISCLCLFEREYEHRSVFIAHNVGSREQRVTLPDSRNQTRVELLFSTRQDTPMLEGDQVRLPGYSSIVVRLN